MIKKSKPVFSKGANLSIEPATGVIKGVVILQAGKDKIGDNFDEVALNQLVTLGNAQSQGVKSRFGHPNMCDDALGTYVGRYKNYSISTNADGRKVVIADLQLDDTSKRSPKGNLYDYVIEMAQKNSDMFGNSIVYKPADEQGVEEKDENGQPIFVYYQRFESYVASDLVDSPAATTSLFKSDKDFAAKATEWLDANPEIFELVEKHPNVLKEFFTKYSKNLKPNKKMTFKEKIKAALVAAGILNEKDFQMQTSEGDTINIADPDGDGKPMPGDIVTDDEGNILPNGKIAMQDGSTINTDANGAITTVTPKPAAPPAGSSESAPAGKSIEERLTDLEKKFNDEVAVHKADNEESLKTIENLTKRLAALKSTGNPKTSTGTQFRGQKLNAEMTSEERKKAALKNNPKLAKKLGVKIED